MIKTILKITTLVVIFPFMLSAQTELKEIQLQIVKMNDALKAPDYLKAQAANVAISKQIAELTGKFLSKAFPQKVDDWIMDTVNTYSFVATQGTDLAISRDYYPKGSVPDAKKNDTIAKELSDIEHDMHGPATGTLGNPKKIVLTLTNAVMEAQGIMMKHSNASNMPQAQPGVYSNEEVETPIKVKNQRATLKVLQSMHKIEISILCGASVIKVAGFNADLPILNKFTENIDYAFVKSILGE